MIWFWILLGVFTACAVVSMIHRSNDMKRYMLATKVCPKCEGLGRVWRNE